MPESEMKLTPRVSIAERLYDRYKSFWPLYALVFLSCLILGYCYIRYTVPSYSSSALIMILSPDRNLTDLQGPAGEAELRATKNIDDEVAVLSSTPLLEQVVKDLHLYAEIYYKGKIVNKPAYTTCPVVPEFAEPDSITPVANIKLEFNWEKQEVTMEGKPYQMNTWFISPFGKMRFIYARPKHPAIQSGVYYFSLTNVKKMALALQGSLDIEGDKKETTLINLKITNEIPERGEAILTDLINVYNERSISDKTTSAQNTLRFVQKRLRLMGSQLDTMEGGIERFRTDQGVIDMHEQNSQYISTVNTNDQRLSQLNTEFAVLDQIENYLKSNTANSSLAPSTFGINDPLLPQMLEKLSDLKIQYERLRKTTAENNPILVAIRNEMDQLKPNILQIIQTHRNSLNFDKANIESNTSKVNSILNTMPEKERQLSGISRQQNTKNSIYNFLLQKREEAEIAMITATADSKTIESPVSTAYPVNPKKVFVYFVALGTALILIVCFIGLSELMNHSFRDQHAIESLTSLPVIAEITKLRSADFSFMKSNDKSLPAYRFRQLRSALLHDLKNFENKIIQVTSGSPGEGKSFVAFNLALSIAQIDKKVVLVEMDLYKPRLGDHLGFSVKKGLSDYLNDKASFEEIGYDSKEDKNLTLIPGGTAPENPSELLMKQKTSLLLADLNQRFDVVILLTAPLMYSTDAYDLNVFADKTLFVIRDGFTDKRDFEQLLTDKGIYQLKDLSIVYNFKKERYKIGSRKSHGYA